MKASDIKSSGKKSREWKALKLVSLIFLTSLFGYQASAYNDACLINYKFRMVCRAPVAGGTSNFSSGLLVSYREFYVSQNPTSQRICPNPSEILQRFVSADVIEEAVGSADGNIYQEVPEGRLFTSTLSRPKSTSPATFLFMRSNDGIQVRVRISDDFFAEPQLHHIDQIVNCEITNGSAPSNFP